ncbi:hypothetical protein CW304_23655 [Bacillus sp. UFRGS-B20]|nr:hypothetical protein CW304_23655 [Bacillus sp. UFRGS-B20]
MRKTELNIKDLTKERRKDVAFRKNINRKEVREKLDLRFLISGETTGDKSSLQNEGFGQRRGMSQYRCERHAAEERITDIVAHYYKGPLK